ncbi:uncharacterized protein LOC105195285 [Solenopsis invicta]|uniref:uncharacterized protein LOC105195285 n=1 Tax=Solenopsis invicta TaxID=13686 RepID=UPI000E33F1C6|nr:uncharacterized protein LOC105195285 [Solenopsis invicta]
MKKDIHVQVKDNSPSIERILRPISYTSWLLGVGVAHPRKCPKIITIIIRIIHIFLCSVSVTYDAIYFFPYVQKLDIFDSIYCLSKVMCYVSTYYYIYHGIGQYNKWPELMDRLEELDQKIRKEISMNDRSIKIVETLAIFATFISCPLILIIHVLYRHLQTVPIYDNDIPDFMFYYLLSQSLIYSFVFDVIVYVLYCRFQAINKLIGQLDKSSDLSWVAFKIRGIRKLYSGICDFASMVNDIHGSYLLLCSANCFIMAVAALFQSYIFVIERDYEFILIQNFFCIAYVTQFYLICWICTLVRQESNRTGRIIYEIMLNYKPANLDNQETRNQSSLEMRPSLENLDGERDFNRSSSHHLNCNIKENSLSGNLDQECVAKEINDFSIQLQQNQIVFTACDFFEINNALFRSFVAVIISYLVIVGQLYQQPEDLSTLKKLILKMTKKNQTVVPAGAAR